MKRRIAPFGIELHTHFIDRLAMANGLISGLALYPQLFMALIGGTDNLSGATYFLILVNSVVWALYALHRGLVSLLLASLLNALAAFFLLALAVAAP